jgi:hypothetical protein
MTVWFRLDVGLIIGMLELNMNELLQLSMLIGFILGGLLYKTAPIPSHKLIAVLKTSPIKALYLK